ncbi:MAG: PAS domain S-box protein [Bauldia sp.]
MTGTAIPPGSQDEQAAGRADDMDDVYATPETFRILVESVTDSAIIFLDPDGYVTSWNKGSQRIKGYYAAEIVGQHLSRFYPAADVEAGEPMRELQIALKDGRFEEEGWRVRKDGSQFWASRLLTP